MEAPLIDHLAEIRQRILTWAFFFGLVFAFTLYQSEWLIDMLVLPLRQVDPTLKLAVLSLTEGFFTTIKLAAYAALVISFPIALWQIWRFVEPGLQAKEKQWCKRLFLPAIFLFFTGAGFCYLVALPAAVRFLITALGNRFQPVFSVAGYVDFAIFFTLVLGLAFELPLLMVFLNITGLFPVKRLRHYQRHALVTSMILGAIVSPPDPVSQILVGLPIFFLFQVGIWACQLLDKKQHSDNNEEQTNT